MSETPELWQIPLVGPAVWTSAELGSDQNWTHQLTPKELAELHSATNLASSWGLQSKSFVRADLPLPNLDPIIARMRRQLDIGRGLFLLQALNVQEYRLDQFLGLGCILATSLDCSLISQNSAGEQICLVTDCNETQIDEYKARGHRGRTEMLHHSDSSDIVVLLCVHAAKSGGATSVCSSAAVYNAILQENANNLLALQKGFFFDMTGKTDAGVSQYRVPIFSNNGPEIKCQYNKKRIEVGMQTAGIPLSQAELGALERMSHFACHPDLALRFVLHPGDILFINNFRVLHARDAYEDWPQPERKRLLIRFWLNRQESATTLPSQ